MMTFTDRRSGISLPGLSSVIRYLDVDGTPLTEVPLWAHEMDGLVKAYEWTMMTRTFDQKAVALQRTGQIGTYPSSLGQEAISVACGLALEPQPEEALFDHLYAEWPACLDTQLDLFAAKQRRRQAQ